MSPQPAIQYPQELVTWTDSSILNVNIEESVGQSTVCDSNLDDNSRSPAVCTVTATGQEVSHGVTHPFNMLTAGICSMWRLGGPLCDQKSPLLEQSLACQAMCLPSKCSNIYCMQRDLNSDTAITRCAPDQCLCCKRSSAVAPARKPDLWLLLLLATPLAG